MIIGLENKFVVFLRVAILRRFYCKLVIQLICILGNFSYFCCHLRIFFSKLTFSKTAFRNTFRVSKGLDPIQNRHFGDSDLGPNCLQRLSAAQARKEIKF